LVKHKLVEFKILNSQVNSFELNQGNILLENALEMFEKITHLKKYCLGVTQKN